jgi:hypothetical protein
MPTPPEVSPIGVFISYAHEDRPIAQSLEKLFKDAFGRKKVKPFLDISSLRAGGSIPQEIEANLSEADVLLIVATGIRRPVYDWGGLELGYFKGTHKNGEPRHAMYGKVIPICVEGSEPRTVADLKCISFGIKTKHLVENEYTRDETQFGERQKPREPDELMELLWQFQDVIQPRDGESRSRDDESNFRDHLNTFRKNIFAHLKGRIRGAKKYQHQLIVRYKAAAIEKNRFDLPGDATIVSVDDSLRPFGLEATDPDFQAPSSPESPGQKRVLLTWDLFKQKVTGDLANYWCSSLARTILSAQSGVVDNNQVITSADWKRYRLIVTTVTTYFTNEFETSLYLVEALKRPDRGYPETTQLLKGLNIVCRFRFFFMEKMSDFYYVNFGSKPVADLPRLANALTAELDFQRSEAMDAELHQPGNWEQFMDVTVLNSMLETWGPLAGEIRQLCSDALQEGTQERQKQIFDGLKARLKRIYDEFKIHNSALIGAIAGNLIKLTAVSPIARADGAGNQRPVFSSDRIEQVAQTLHDAWWEYKRNQGFTLGPRDMARKTHPHLMHWESMDIESRNQERFQASVLLAPRVQTLNDVAPSEIHEAWRLWEQVHRRQHPHDQPFSEAHAQDVCEHEAQAAKVNELLRRWRA